MRLACRTMSRVAPVLLGLAGCSSEQPDDKLGAIKPPPVAEVMAPSAALAKANLRRLDPEPMPEAQIRNVIRSGPWCGFRYTADGDPVLAIAYSGGDAVVRLNGSLIPLKSLPGQDLAYTAENLSFQIEPSDSQARPRERTEADMVFAVAGVMEVGYGGYFECPAPRQPER
jgi:hypothetical protein